MAHVIKNKEEFDNAIKEGLVLVDFYADWCGPCKMLTPIIEEVSNEYTKASICKVNVDELEEVARSYNVASIPTLILFKDGKAIKTQVGFLPKPNIIKMLNEAL